MSTGRSRGFTLIEALVATVVLAIGVVGVMGGYGAILNAERRLHESEQMQRLAHQKLDELVATGVATQGGQSGDFSDQDLPDIKWTVSSDTTSVANLNAISVTVTKGSGQDAPKSEARTLLYIAPTTASTGATG